MARWKKVLLFILGAIVLLFVFGLSRVVCLSAYIRYGISTNRCPDGELVQGVSVDANSLRRGSWGSVSVTAQAYFTRGAADRFQTAHVRRGDATLSLVDGEKVRPLKPKKGWRQDGGGRHRAQVMLPKDLKDGKYKLRAEVSTPLGKTQHDVTLSVFAPAKIHVITDRPLYEPGNTIQFRGVLLRARDLVPLEGRPGKWEVIDPDGATVLEEEADAGPFGIVSGSFPLDLGAPTGSWRVRYLSGGTSEEIRVRVEPFTLPRFSVEASPVKSYYRAGERPRLRGQVRYSSGAPVSDALLELRWSTDGAWPPPSAWMSGGPQGLPKKGQAKGDGSFELALPLVPKDLKGRATLSARITAIDPAGDRIEGAAQILLSEDAIEVSAVTEMRDGLVDGFNNRVYLRVTTASGQVLPGAQLVVRRAWDANDPGVKAKADEDGVAALQLDPGPAVNIVVPPMPVRPPPRPKPIERTAAQELITQRTPRLKDLVALDALQPKLAACARFVSGRSDSVTVGLRVSASGAVTDVAGRRYGLADCLAGKLRGARLPAGADRVLELRYRLTADLPTLSMRVMGAPEAPEQVRQAFAAALLDARRCLPELSQTHRLGRLMFWSVKKGVMSLSFGDGVKDPRPKLASAAALCVQKRLSTVKLTKEEGRKISGDRLGIARFEIEPGPRYQSSKPQATTMLGYELEVSASLKNEKLGKTKIRLRPGRVPDVRLRAEPVLAKAGQTVTIKLLRGPKFRGKLPKKMSLRHELGNLKADFDATTKTVKFELPKDRSGFYEARFQSARAIVFVRRSGELQVEVKPDKPTYAPGDTAKLAVKTTAGGKGAPAAVGLIGVDQSLGQLAPLPGPSDMAKLKPKVGATGKAFGAIDVEALTLGRVRGANAKAATILKVTSIPSPAEIDNYVSAHGKTRFDPLEKLTDHFYTALEALHVRARAWEKSAPKGEMMRPKTMAKLWADALADSQKAGRSVEDAFGRKLRLHRLPSDLLALTDPRAVILEGTRLPEDVENWTAWVRKERP